MRRVYFLLLFVFCASFFTPSSAKYHKSCLHSGITVYQTPDSLVAGLHPADTTVHHKRKHKLWAALLCMPLGVFGLHRVYLGTSWAVPYLYLATIGGCWGILPFVDFCQIILCKDINTYADNPRVFMWTRKKPKPAN